MTPPPTDLDRLNELEAKDFRQIGFIKLWLSGTLCEIYAVAQKARESHSVVSHHCELRRAIDSICDRSKVDMKMLEEAGKGYNTTQLRELDDLRSQLTASQESERRMREALESSHMGRAVVHWMRAYDSLKVSDDSDANCQIVRVPKHMIPNGAKLVEAYETERQFIILGHPESDDESHNCDEMGCSTLSHVVARLDKAALTTPVKAEGVEE